MLIYLKISQIPVMYSLLPSKHLQILQCFIIQIGVKTLDIPRTEHDSPYETGPDQKREKLLPPLRHILNIVVYNQISFG